MTWALVVIIALAVATVGLILVRRDEIVRWNTNRREGTRRKWERRSGADRRGEHRLEHDARVSNPNRRRSDRREEDRRQEADWKSRLDTVRERVEEIQHDNRNQ